MAVGDIDLRQALGFDLNGVDIQKPCLVGGLGKKNIPCVIIGMQDPVLAAFVKQFTDGGKSTTSGGGGWACGEE
jgi:hypothetical protein